MSPRPTYKELERRCLLAESALEAIRTGQADTVMGKQGLLVLELEEAQSALQKAEAKYRALAETSPDITYIIDLVTFKTDYMNRETLLGYRVEELEQQGSIISRVHPDDLPAVNAHWREIVSGNEIHEVDYRLKLKDGRWEWLNSRPRILSRDADGKPTQVLVTLSIITQRKQIEEALRQSEENYRFLLDNTNDFIARFDRNGVVVFATEASLGFNGYQPEEIINTLSFDRIHPEDQAKARDELKRVIETNVEGRVEYRLKRKDGAYIWVEASGRRVLNSAGEPEVIVVQRDITDRKQAEEALRRSEEKFSLAFMSNPAAIIVSRLADGVQLDVNEAYCRLVGYSREELLGHPTSEFNIFIRPDQRRELVEQLKTDGAIRNKEVVLKNKEGELRTVLASLEKLTFNNDECILTTLVDITDRKQAQAELLAAQQFNRSIIDGLGTPLCVLDGTGSILTVNRAWREFADANPPAPQNYGVGFNYLEICENAEGANSEEATPFAAGLRSVLYGASNSFDLEYPCHSPTGEQRWFTAHVSRFLSGGRMMAVVTHENITKRKLAEETLRESEEKFRTVADFTHDWEYWVAPNGEMLYVSPSCERISGHTAEEFQTKANLLEEILHPEDVSLLQKHIKDEFESEEPIGVDFRVVTPTGEIRWINHVCQLVHGADGRWLGRRASNRDITERKAAEESLLKSEERYRALFENVPVAIWEQDFSQIKNHLDSLRNHGVMDLRAYFAEHPEELLFCLNLTRILNVNQTAVVMYEAKDKQELIRSTMYETSESELNNGVDEMIAIAEGRTSRFWEGSDETLTGRRIDIHVTWSVAPGHERDYSRVIVTTVDVTEQKQAEAEQLRLIQMLELSLNEIYIFDNRNLNFTYANQGALKNLGYSMDELRQMTPVDLKPEFTEETFRDVIRPLIDLQKDALVFETVHRRKNGEIYPVEVHLQLVTTYTGRNFVAVIHDISERKKAEEALLNSHAIYRQAIEVAGAVPYYQTYYEEGRRVKYDFIGEGIRQITGYGPGEFTAGLWDSLTEEIVMVGDLAGYSLEEAIQLVRGGRYPIWKCEHRIRDRQGAVHWVFEAAVELRDENGLPYGSIGMYQDITERKRAEASLTQRLAELELLYQSGLALSGELEPKQVAGKLIELLERKMDWHHIAIRKYDREKDRLELLAFKQTSMEDDESFSQRTEERLSKSVTHSGQGLSGWVAHHGQTVRVGDVNADTRYIETYPGMGSGLYAPMNLGGHVAGVISVESKQLNAFSESDDRLLKTVASQAAVAFENARLFQDLQRELAERIQAEAARHQSEERYRQTLDSMMEGCQIIGFDWRYLYVNDTAAQHGRMPRESLIGRTMQEVYPGIETTVMFGVLRECMESRMACRMENEFIYPDGTSGWFDLGIQPIPEGIFILSVDTTERKMAEQALRSSEERMRLTLQTTSDGFWIVDQEGKFLEANNAYCEMSGYTRSELLQMSIPDVETIEERLETKKHIEMIWGESHDRFETRHRRKDGSEYDVEISANLLDEKSGLLVCFCRDITERKKAEQALRENEARLGEAARIAHFGYWDRNFIAQTITLSEEACQIFGISSQYRFFNLPEWHEQWLQLIHPEDRQRVAQILRDTLAGGPPYSADYRVIRPDGDIRHVHSFADLTRDESGKPTRLFGTMIDVTERKLAEREILHHTQDLTLINSLNEAANRGESVETITNIFTQEAYSMFDCRDATVYLISPDGKFLEMQNISISNELSKQIEEFIGISIPKIRLPIREGSHTQTLLSHTEGIVTDDPEEIQKWMLEFTETVFLPNVLRAPIRAIMPRIFELLEIHSTITIPLVSSGQTIGLMDFSSANRFTGEELQRLLPLTRQITAILLRKQAEANVQMHLKRITALNDIDRAIGSSHDMRLSLEVLLKEVVLQLGVDAADVLLVNPVNQALEYGAGRGFRATGIRQTHLILGQGFAGRVGLDQKSMHIPDLKAAESEFARSDLLRGEEFMEYFGVPLLAKGALKGVLEIFNRTPLTPDPDWLSYLETLGGQAAIAIESAELFATIQRANQELMFAYDATIAGWSHAMDLRDKETEGHSQRVTEVALRLAGRMGVSQQEQIHMRRGALLHDIGKLGVPDHILLKPGKLSEEEWAIMHKHPVYAFEMLLPITYLQPALDIPYCHHEKWDGSGYPRKLKGEQIPLAARIFAVVDVWDALRSDRPYRPGWSAQRIREHIRSESGKHFDPRVVDAFLSMLDESPEMQ